MVSKVESSVILEACKLGRLNQQDNTWLFQDISLKVSGGERIALTGESGAGKTVFMRSLIFLDGLDAGDVFWRNEKIEDESMPHFRTRVLYLHQKPTLFSGTVKDNLDKPFEFASNKDRERNESRVLSWLKTLGRDESFLDRDISNLSGGEEQMVCVLRGLQIEPDLLLLDEPTSQLDSKSTGLIEKLILSWLEDRPGERAFIWTTHQEEQAERVSNRRLYFDAGELREVGK